MGLVAPAGTNELKNRVADIIRTHDANSSRSTQTHLGPSEIGEQCDRRLTYRLLDMAMPDIPNGDPWPAIVGTATHAWLADAFQTENQRMGRLRYLVETRVRLTDGIGGTCDLYDLDQNAVIDHKVLGVDSLRKIRNGNIPDRYRVQVHLYGYGFALAGLPVQNVNIVAYPRSGFLDGIAVWTEPYSERVAVDAMDRLGRLTTAAYALELDDHPERWELIPAKPGADCSFCPFWRPGEKLSDRGCPGQVV